MYAISWNYTLFFFFFLEELCNLCIDFDLGVKIKLSSYISFVENDQGFATNLSVKKRIRDRIIYVQNKLKSYFSIVEVVEAFFHFGVCKARMGGLSQLAIEFSFHKHTFNMGFSQLSIFIIHEGTALTKAKRAWKKKRVCVPPFMTIKTISYLPVQLQIALKYLHHFSYLLHLSI